MKIGSPALQRKLVDLIPSKRLRRGKQISDEIEKHAKYIFEQKKRAMREGDEAVVHQIGEGKDIMSKLSACVRCGARWIGGADARCSAGEHACE